MLEIEAHMRGKRLETKQYLSVQGDELYLLVRAPEDLLEDLAEQFDFELECRPRALRAFGNKLSERFPHHGAHSFNIPNSFDLSVEGTNASGLYEPYEHMWMPFKRDPRFRGLYYRHSRTLGRLLDEREVEDGEGDTFFTACNRIKLIQALLEKPVDDGGCGVDEHKLLKHDWSIFPLHTRHERDTLQREWLGANSGWVGSFQPLDRSSGAAFPMKDYIGERVAL